ncbi:MAG: hypothetical protein IH941_03145 [Acidobacteria bacterium]|nr:hypothetical protein [Acidobacteriota bacterium]
MRRSAIAVAALMLVVAACGGDDALPAVTIVAAGPGLQLELSSGGGPVGGPIPITVTLTNGTGGTLTVARPFFAGNIVAFTVEDDAGNLIPFDGPFAELEPLHDDRIATLAPGESVSHDFDLADHFVLEAGTYTVTAGYRFQPPEEGSRALAVAPGEGPHAAGISVEVTP